jgi:hypothetical protein
MTVTDGKLDIINGVRIVEDDSRPAREGLHETFSRLVH